MLCEKSDFLSGAHKALTSDFTAVDSSPLDCYNDSNFGTSQKPARSEHSVVRRGMLAQIWSLEHALIY